MTAAVAAGTPEMERMVETVGTRTVWRGEVEGGGLLVGGDRDPPMRGKSAVLDTEDNRAGDFLRVRVGGGVGGVGMGAELVMSGGEGERNEEEPLLRGRDEGAKGISLLVVGKGTEFGVSSRDTVG